MENFLKIMQINRLLEHSMRITFNDKIYDYDEPFMCSQVTALLH